MIIGNVKKLRQSNLPKDAKLLIPRGVTGDITVSNFSNGFICLSRESHYIQQMNPILVTHTDKEYSSLKELFV